MKAEVLRFEWDDVEIEVDEIVEQVGRVDWDTVVAVMRGGMVPARMIAAKLGVENIVMWDVNHGTFGKLGKQVLVVDDIADSGATAKLVASTFRAPLAVLVTKVGVGGVVRFAGLRLSGGDKRWVAFPWEGKADKVGVRQSRGK